MAFSEKPYRAHLALTGTMIATVTALSAGVVLDQLGVTKFGHQARELMGLDHDAPLTSAKDNLVNRLGMQTKVPTGMGVELLVADLIQSDLEAKALCDGYELGDKGDAVLREFGETIPETQNQIDRHYPGFSVAVPTRQRCENDGDWVVYKSTLAFTDSSLWFPTTCEVVDVELPDEEVDGLAKLTCSSGYDDGKTRYVLLERSEGRVSYAGLE